MEESKPRDSLFDSSGARGIAGQGRSSRRIVMNMRRRSFLASALVVPSILRGYKPQIGNLTADGAVNNPYGLRIGPDGSLYVCEIGNHRVSRIDVKSGAVQPLVADQKEPYEVQFASDGSLLFVDMPAHSVRRWDKSSDK